LHGAAFALYALFGRCNPPEQQAAQHSPMLRATCHAALPRVCFSCWFIAFKRMYGFSSAKKRLQANMPLAAKYPLIGIEQCFPLH
jgi:hypothetical protein